MERSTILLVDDNPQILSILSDLLRPLGYRLLTASGGETALALAAEHQPDLVLLDVMMPGLDGFTVTQRLRANAAIAQVPVILITALDDRESRVRGFEAGADDFITKPFDYAELRARITTVLRLNRYRRLIEEQARVAAERARFAWAVEQSDDGYVIVDADDTLRYANLRARALLGLPPEGLPPQPFATLAAQLFHLVPPESWAGWPAAPDEPRYLVRPETTSAGEFWMRADLLAPPPGGDDTRVVRLRDVTTQITSQREMWTFHAMVTHKLRTPLVSIIGGLNILSNSQTPLDPAAVQRIARLAEAGARRLQSEIEDILNYLRPPADLYGSDACLFVDLPDLITASAAELGIDDITISSGPGLAGRRLAIARHSLAVALRELLENTRKFHPRFTPTVDVSLSLVDGRSLAIRIGDNGVGLSPDQIARAWRPYYQGERSFTGQVDGMGLGLPLVARIVLAVGGSYTIANRADGPGAVVELVLPLAEQR
jgi:DNA-binding response OmpR family regulator